MKKKRMKRVIKAQDEVIKQYSNAVKRLLLMMEEQREQATMVLEKMGVYLSPLDSDKVERIKRSTDSENFWKNAGRVNDEQAE